MAIVCKSILKATSSLTQNYFPAFKLKKSFPVPNTKPCRSLISISTLLKPVSGAIYRLEGIT